MGWWEVQWSGGRCSGVVGGASSGDLAVGGNSVCGVVAVGVAERRGGGWVSSLVVRYGRSHFSILISADIIRHFIPCQPWAGV